MKNIGVDIVEFARIKRIGDVEKFVDKILSEKEKAVYVTLKHDQRQLEYLAGRFASKEAIYKAAPDLCAGKGFIDFSILNDETGAPYLAEPPAAGVMLTLSHSEHYVVAFAVLI
ncbi:MAG: holo-ACP synthase [Turicibacter sp.]|nr:holo-ACP synthase [Turicibacter sp.]